MAKEKDVLLDHDYDGIKELDNDLPPWWVYLFYVTIVFAVVYLIYYHVADIGDLPAVELQKEYNPNWEKANSGPFSAYQSPLKSVEGDLTPYLKEQFAHYIGPDVSSDELLMAAMQKADADQLAKLKEDFPDLWEKLTSAEGPVEPAAAPAQTSAETVPAAEIKALKDAESLAEGKAIFTKNCVSCHGAHGEGGIGPNMTDDYWLHGPKMSQMVHTITVGVPAKGMIPWRGTLKEDQIIKVASYLRTLRGTNPPNAKAPQGELVENMDEIISQE